MSKCILVRTGDKIGYSIEEEPGAVSYSFDASDPTSLTFTPENAAHHDIMVGDTVEFDSLVFPYDYNLAAYVDTSKQNRRWDWKR